MANEPDDSDGRTVQMSADQLARLHRELGIASEAPAPEPVKHTSPGRPAPGVSRTAATAEPAAVRGARPPAPVPAPVPVPDAEYAEPEPEYAEPEPEYAEPEPEPEPEYAEPEPEPLPAPAVKGKPAKAEKPAKPAPAPKAEKPVKEKPAKAPKPVKPAAADVAYADGGGAMCVLGGIGALIVAALTILAMLPLFDIDLGLDRDVAGIIGSGGTALAHTLLFLGMLGAAKSTNGLAVLVGIFHLVVALLAAFILIAGLASLDVGPDVGEILMLLWALLPGTTWLLSGIWGLSAGRGMGGALAGIYGTLALVAGGSGLALAILMRMQGGLEPDIAQILMITSVAATAVAAVVLMIAMFGPLRRGPVVDT